MGTAPRERHRRWATAALAAAAIAGAALPAPPLSAQLWALAAGVAAGLPHGALDVPAAAARLRGRFGRGWPLPFLGFYLGLATLVLAAWTAEPRIALGLFLCVSALHFGLGDAEGRGALRPVAAAAHGGTPLVVPALAHPEQVAAIFEQLAPGGGSLAALLAGPAAVAWTGAIAVLIVGGRPWAHTAARGPLIELAAVIAVFALLPPLLAFALYFGLLHAPRASLAEAAAAGGPPGRALRRLAHAAVPASLVALAGAAAAFLLLRGPLGAPSAALSVIFVGLAALTVPHMALGAALRWAGRVRPAAG